MKCPIHDEELRQEHTEEGFTAICLKCPKRYRLCHATKHMRSCDKILGHDMQRPIEDGTEVVYARGVKEPLIGKMGVVVSPRDADGIALICFESGTYPCWINNLEPTITKHRAKDGTEWEAM